MLDGARTSERRYAAWGHSATMQLKRGMSALGEHRSFSMLAYVWRRTRDAETGKQVPHGDRNALPLLARSGFIPRSPRRVSRKREFSWIRPETFGNSRTKKFDHRSPETTRDEKSPHLAGLSHQGKNIL